MHLITTEEDKEQTRDAPGGRAEISVEASAALLFYLSVIFFTTTALKKTKTKKPRFIKRLIGWVSSNNFVLLSLGSSPDGHVRLGGFGKRSMWLACKSADLRI